MRHLLALWLLCLGVTLLVVVPVEFAITRTADLRYGPFLTILVAPVVEATVLMLAFPQLRDRASLAAALRRPAVSRAASVLLIVIVAVAALWTLRVVPPNVFSNARVTLLTIGGAIFLAAARRVPIAAGVAAIALGVALITGRGEWVALRILPAQPLLFRWIAFYGTSAIVVTTAIVVLAARLRRASPAAAVILEWSLAPALIASLIVIANVFWHPFLTSAWWMIANVLGMTAASAIVLAAVAAVTDY